MAARPVVVDQRTGALGTVDDRGRFRRLEERETPAKALRIGKHRVGFGRVRDGELLRRRGDKIVGLSIGDLLDAIEDEGDEVHLILTDAEGNEVELRQKDGEYRLAVIDEVARSELEDIRLLLTQILEELRRKP